VIFIDNLRNLAQLIKVELFSFSREGGNKMPNYVRNILQINAPPEKIEEVFNAIQSDTDPEQLFDFNKIIPMPKSLEIEAGSQEDLVSLYMTYINPKVDYYGIQSNTDPIPTIKQNPFLPRYRDDLSKEEIEKMLQRFGNYSEAQCLQIGKQYYDNYLQHGATSWYHWCIDNWGTKWNACDAYKASDNIVVFDTAWSCPEPIIQKLSEMFDVNVKVVYADEDYGSGNCGFLEYEAGVLQEECHPDTYDQASEFSENVWSSDDYVEEFKFEQHPQLTMLC